MALPALLPLPAISAAVRFPGRPVGNTNARPWGDRWPTDPFRAVVQAVPFHGPRGGLRWRLRLTCGDEVERADTPGRPTFKARCLPCFIRAAKERERVTPEQRAALLAGLPVPQKPPCYPARDPHHV